MSKRETLRGNRGMRALAAAWRRHPRPAAPRPERFDFDALALDLARGLSRREALARLGGALLGALVAFLGMDKAWAACPAGQAPCANVDVSICCPPGQGCIDPPSLTCGPCTMDSQCAAGQLCCSGVCQDPCGGQCCSGVCCNNTCFAAGSTCCGGVGACPPGQNCCQDQFCANLQADVNNCGACGFACMSGQSCCNGACSALTTDSNCGACGNACPASAFCEVPPLGGTPFCRCTSGQVPCGPGAGVCCPTGQFCSSVNARNGTCICLGTGLPPCSGTCCGFGQHCQDGVCMPGCVSDANCPVSAFCVNGACLSCKGPGDVCDQNKECCSGHCRRSPLTGARFCASCPDGQTLCGESCVDTQTDPSNCGQCGSVCGGPCCAGVCCAAGQQCRRNPFTGARFCASCPAGQVCAGSQGSTCCDPRAGATCCDGICCPSGQHCENGACVPGCLSNDNCNRNNDEHCSNGVCCGSGEGGCRGPGGPVCCGPPSEVVQACCGSKGSICCNTQFGTACCDGICCPSGQHCENGVCVPGCLSNDNCNKVNTEYCCSGVCVDLSGGGNDPRNCGACGRVCSAPAICSNGRCCRPTGASCALGITCCSGTCLRPSRFQLGVCA